MDQEKFLQIQMQMRHNNDDYKNFLDDMDSWSTKMKEKESTNCAKSNERSEFPQIRNASSKLPKPKPAKIKAYDYQSWDKFDVNKALEECDADEVDTAALVSEHKERGNLYFKEGDYARAIEEYSAAIGYNPSNDALFANRAMCFLKLSDYAAAEADCSAAISISANCVKAFYRRAKCRLALLRPDAAVDDLRAVIRIDPTNKTAARELRQLEAELNTRGVVEPLQEPRKDRQSSLPLRRIAIVDVDPNKCFFDSAATNASEQMTDASGDVSDMRECSQLPPPPRSSMQLSKDLSRLRGEPHRLGEYVAALEFASIRRLIGHALDCEMVVDIVNGLCCALADRVVTAERFVDAVNALHGVARFASSWLMIGDDERAAFRRAVATIGDVLGNKLLVSL